MTPFVMAAVRPPISIGPCVFIVGLICSQAAHAQQAEQTSDKAYKNIQILKGVPVSEFMNTMFFHRYALGVSCSYCHVGGQWEKDDKPAKAKARKMIQMVLDLNRTVFQGKKAANCMTCHRGSTKPQTEIPAVRLTLDAMLGPDPRPIAPKAPATDTSVGGVLNRYVAALGGRENLSKVKNTLTTGTLMTSEGLIVPYEEAYEMTPSRWVYVRHFGEGLGDFSTGLDGQEAWNSDNRGFSTQAGLAKARSAMAAELQTGLGVATLYTGLSYSGAEIVGSTPAIVLAGIARITGERERLYFDIGTGLLVRRSTLTDGVYGAYTTDVYFEDYQSADGVMAPNMVSQFTPDNGAVRKLSSVKHNTAIPASMFAPPKK